MPSPEQMQILWNMSDDVLYPEAVAFIHRLVDEEDCIPLPASQVTGLLNIANASSYLDLNLFIRHQRDRDWQESKKDIKTFYTELDKLFTTIRNKRLRESFPLTSSGTNSKEVNKELDELMVFVAHDFIQHLITENALLLVEKAAQRARKWSAGMAKEHSNRYTLRNRYLFKGNLVLQTALHIGGGRATLSSSDSPVVLTPEEIPFIPGSSFKGSLRSTVEKLVPSIAPDLFSCALIELSPAELTEALKLGDPICSTARQKEITQDRRENPGAVETILAKAREDCCATCKLFGSPFAAARMAINDLYIPEGAWSGVLQLRDGVAIDRDSEKAKDRLKYDFEVVPASAAFALEMTLENATPQDLQLISVGLSEFVHGFATIGGKRSRGLGACRLENLRVSALELELTSGINETTRNRRLRDYLIDRKFSSEEDGSAFINKHIDLLFTGTAH
jgi:CRISPR-associated RAMP protein (TIGR02581 family)